METAKRTLIAMVTTVVTMFTGVSAFADNADAYPGAVLVFKKYYPANETHGMANDDARRLVYISSDTQHQVISWYEQHFSTLPIVAADERGCYRKHWKFTGNKTLDLTICDRNSYRTILLVIPGK